MRKTHSQWEAAVQHRKLKVTQRAGVGIHWWLRLQSLPAVRETRVQSLGWEDSLEKGMATHPSILAWRIPWTEEPGGLQF